MLGPSGFEAGLKYATDGSLQIASRTGENITFTNGNDGTERMRIDSSGGVGIGASTIPADHRLQIHNPSFTYSRFALTNSATGSASGDGLKFQIENLNAIIKNQEDGYLTFGTNGRETDLHIDSSGQVGIGTTDPEDKLEVAGGALKVKASANHVEQTYIKFGRTDQADGNFEHHIKSMTGSGSTQNKMTFSLCDTSATGKVDLLTLDGGANKSYFASGSVGIGNTNPSGQLDILTSNETMIKLRNSDSTSGLDRDFKLDDNNKFEILDNSGTGVSLSQGSGSWSSESDERLKENIVELDSVLENIDNLRAVKYNYKKGNDTKIGFIAQDWQKDFSEVIEEGEHLQMKYTETIPVLLKAIQELKARIEILENN
jgi:hypothetical protein